MKRLLTCAIVAFTCLTAIAKNDITVAQDGSGDFTSIQEAILSVRAEMGHRTNIHVKKGVYKEKIVVPTWCINVSLIGEDRDSTIIEWNDHANMQIDGKKMGTFRTYTIKVQGHGFRAENLTIANNAPLLGQAVALHVEGDQAVFVNCRIIGNQDTIYAGSATSRQLYDKCEIEGTTDFIFGPATCFFDKCVIRSKKNSYITAPSTPEDKKYGLVFNECKLIAADGIHKVYLGRPWRPYGASAFINCEMDSHICPEGWDNWRNAENEKTARFIEIGSKGSGANDKARVKWAKTSGKAKDYTRKKVIGF